MAVECAHLSLDDLVSRAAEMASQLADGHYTLLRFTGGYKIAFGTVDLDDGLGRRQVNGQPSWDTLRDAFVYLVEARPHIGAPVPMGEQ